MSFFNYQADNSMTYNFVYGLFYILLNTVITTSMDPLVMSSYYSLAINFEH